MKQPDNNIVEQLEQRIKKLEAENAELQRTIERKNDAAAAQTGRIEEVAAKYQRQRDEEKAQRIALIEEYQDLRDEYMRLRRKCEELLYLEAAVGVGSVEHALAVKRLALPNVATDAFTRGTIQALRNYLGDVIEERDFYKDGLHTVLEVQADALKHAIEETNESRKQLFKQAEMLEDVSNKKGLPYIAETFLDFYDFVESYHAEALEETRNLHVLNQDHDDLTKEVMTQLSLLMFLCRARESADIGAEILVGAIAHANDPRMVAYDIFVDLRGGKVDMQTLQRLSQEWIQENLPDAPKTLEKLADGLKWAHKWRSSGKTILTFTDLIQGDAYGVTDKTLRTYIKWYKVFDELVRESSKFTDFLPATDEENS